MMLIPTQVRDICASLRAAGYQAWLVGGAVRDRIMGREPRDWDVATNARPDAVARLFDRVVLVGEKHGTVAVVVDGQAFEVTTFRGDGQYSDGRHPDSVSFVGTIDEDLARRDFTMNAIAYDPVSKQYADPFGGMAAVLQKKIRCVGWARDRMAEDGLRSLRACRFAATLEFKIADDVQDAIRATLDVYAKVAPERLHAEWMKTMEARRPSLAFQAMVDTGILGVSVPEMLPMIGCAQNRYHGFDVWGHAMAVLDAVPYGDPVLRVAALFHDVGKPATKGEHPKTGQATFYNHEVVGAEMTGEILHRLKFSTAETDRACHLVRHHLIRYELGDSKAAIRRWVRKVGMGNVASLLALARADIAGKGDATEPRDTSAIDDLEARLDGMQTEEVIPTSASHLAIDGNDIMEHLKIGPGPLVGRHLRHLLEVVTDDPSANTRDALLSKLGGRTAMTAREAFEDFLCNRGGVKVFLLDGHKAQLPPDLVGKQCMLMYELDPVGVPIPDLDVTDEGIRATLSFSRTPFATFVPWSSVAEMVAMRQERAEQVSGKRGDGRPKLRSV
jgi:tRNA nucleotidyltransferase (CCA-adding enzyme)